MSSWFTEVRAVLLDDYHLKWDKLATKERAYLAKLRSEGYSPYDAAHKLFMSEEVLVEDEAKLISELTEEYAVISESDEETGYIGDLLGRLSKYEGSDTKTLSSAWTRGRSKKKEPRGIVLDLIKIKNGVRSLLRAHGVPKNLKLELANITAGASGMAGFHDIGTWRRPFIFLDTKVYDSCDAREVYDVYCGIGLHEASHIKHTRTMYERLKSGKLDSTTRRAMWEGLFEDERIEELVRQESPGYAGYLQIMRRALFEKKAFGCAMRKWHNKMTDLDRVCLLIFGLIRCPYLLSPEMKEWRTLKGECVFESLKKLFPTIPESERIVEIYGERLEKFWTRLQAEYKELAKARKEELDKLRGKDKPAKDDKSGESAEGTLVPTDTGETADGRVSDSDGGIKGDSSGADSGDGSSSGDDSERGASSDSDESEELGDSVGEGEDDADETSERAAERVDRGGVREGCETAGSDVGDTGEREPEGSLGEEGETEAGEFEETLEGSPSDEEDGEVDDELERLRMQLDADERDAEFSRLAGELHSIIKTAGDRAARRASMDLTEAMKGGKTLKDLFPEVGVGGDAREALERAFSDREDEGRFSIEDIRHMMEVLDVVTDSLDAEESTELEKVTKERIEFGDEWSADERRKSEGSRSHAEKLDRRTVIIHPQVTQYEKDKYNAYLDKVRGQVMRMRGVFRLRLGKRLYQENERIEGRLHRRKLSQIMSTDRVFFQRNEKHAHGLAICLLLDESGSMGNAGPHPSRSPNRAQIALEVAILISEALKGLPGVELEVYSHASCGDSDMDCQVKYLYGKNNPKLQAIAGFESGAQNYDHMALKTAGDLFIANTQNTSRLMIVLSDGSPCGYMYGGAVANRQTRQAVQNLEKRGVKVMGVAIHDYNASAIYGKNTLKFLDLSDLINRMRRLVVQVIKQNSSLE
jgi:hypothetical protein